MNKIGNFLCVCGIIGCWIGFSYGVIGLGLAIVGTFLFLCACDESERERPLAEE